MAALVVRSNIELSEFIGKDDILIALSSHFHIWSMFVHSDDRSGLLFGAFAPVFAIQVFATIAGCGLTATINFADDRLFKIVPDPLQMVSV